MNICPCGSGKTFSICCEPVISGAQPSLTAERLMRARYSAYVFAKMDFIFASVHPEHRGQYDHKGTKEWAEKSEWLGLEIVSVKDGGERDETGSVEFIARYGGKNGRHEHHELAMFERKDGIWFFTNGDLVRPKPITVEKTGRNAPCTCGSGLKHKKCCGK